MNYMIYAKHKDDKHFGPMKLQNGSVGVGLVYATLIRDAERAKLYADKLTAAGSDFTFQVRVAGRGTIVYEPHKV
jgi:hypothetical protein